MPRKCSAPPSAASPPWGARLTTLGSPVFSNSSLTSVSASVGITIVGQLYVAILIAGVLGKPRQIAAVRKAAHPRRRSQAPSPKLRRIRR